MYEVIHLELLSLSSQSAKQLFSLKWILEIALSPEYHTKRLAKVVRKSALTWVQDLHYIFKLILDITVSRGMPCKGLVVC